MAMHNLRSIVDNASKALLFNPVKVKGINEYTFFTNMLSWDGINNYKMDYIAQDFGLSSGNPNSTRVKFKCGDAYVEAYDLGLLFSCFTAIVSAYTEQGEAVKTLAQDTNVSDIDVVWFGNNLVIYCYSKGLLVTVKSADVKNACKHNKIKLENFTDVREFYLTREKTSMCLSTKRDELVCRLEIPEHVQRCYSKLFDDDPTNDDDVDDPATYWDDRSQLGNLISNSIGTTTANETVMKYKSKVVLASVVVRSDLVCTPSKRYINEDDFLGSLCYTDRGKIALAVNFRDNLLVYTPWFAGGKREILVQHQPSFDSFFNVTEECMHITRYAETVTANPLTAAQLDVQKFEAIKTEFYNMNLPRLKFTSTFGKIVIPESVLVKGLGTLVGESLYCIVPVGAIGQNVICRSYDGSLITLDGDGWVSEAFYDITEVVQ